MAPYCRNEEARPFPKRRTKQEGAQGSANKERAQRSERKEGSLAGSDQVRRLACDIVGVGAVSGNEVIRRSCDGNAGKGALLRGALSPSGRGWSCHIQVKG